MPTDIRKLTSLISGPGGVLVILFFLLPWISISSLGSEIIVYEGKLLEGAGYDFAQGFDANNVEVDEQALNLPDGALDESFDNNDTSIVYDIADTRSTEIAESELDGDSLIFLIPFFGFIATAIAIGTYFSPKLMSPFMGIMLYVIPSIVAALLLIFKYFSIRNEFAEYNRVLVEDGSPEAEIVFGPATDLNIFSVDIEYGFVLTGFALFLILASGIAVFLIGAEEEEESGSFSTATGDFNTLGELPQPSLGSSPRQTIKEDESDPFEKLPKKQYSKSELKSIFLEVKDLIESKRYSEARRLLEGIDHPQAEKWLDQLNKLA